MERERERERETFYGERETLDEERWRERKEREKPLSYKPMPASQCLSNKSTSV